MQLQRTYQADYSQIPVHNTRAMELVTQSETAVIESDVTYGRGGDLMREMTDELKGADVIRLKLNEWARGHIEFVNGEFKKFTQPLSLAIADLRGKLGTYADKIERERIEAEKALQKKREAQAIKHADTLEKSGRPELADAVLDQAVTAPRVETRMDTVRGDVTGATTSHKKVWKCGITDLVALVHDPVAIAVIAGDEQAMNRIRIAIEPYVKAQHKRKLAVPGTSYKQVTQVAAS